MKKILFILSVFSLVLFSFCKDKNAKPGDNQDIPGQITQPGSINPQSAAGRLEQATSAAETSDLVWAGNVDPVCNMEIERDATDTVHYQGKIYGFCSESCKESFQKNPQKWAGKQ